MKFAITSSLVTLAILLLGACASPEDRTESFISKAQEYYDEGDFHRARIEAQNATQITPKNSQARYMLALIAEQLNDPNAMVGNLIIAVDEDPAFIEARLKLAQLFFVGWAYDEAAREVEALMELAPENADVRVLNSRVIFQQGDRETSDAEVDYALKIDPLHVEALMIKAAGVAETDQDAALAILDKAMSQLDKRESKRLRELKLDILSASARDDDLEREIQRLASDFPDDTSYTFKLVELYERQGRKDDAEQVYLNLVLANPEDINSKLNMAQYVSQLRDEEAAISALEQFLAEQPDSQKLRGALATTYDAAGQRERAAEEYRKVADQDPNSPEGLLARSRIAWYAVETGNIETGREMIEAILVENPDNLYALELRAMISYAEKRYGDAIADLRIILANVPRRTEALLLAARSYRMQDLSAQSADSYYRILEITPDHEEALSELTDLVIEQRDFEEAMELLNVQIEKNPEDVQLRSLLIEVLITQNELDAAEELARELILIDEGKVVGAFQLGRILQVQEEYDESAQAYQAALVGAPDSAVALEGLVFSLMRSGKVNEAKKLLEERLAENGDEVAARYLLANILAEEGDLDGARQHYEEVLAGSPQFEDAYLAVARTFSGDIDEQAAIYRRGLDALPGNAQFGVLLGSVYEKKADYENAIVVYEELLEVNPSAMVVRNNLAATLLDRRDDPASHARALELASAFDQTRNPIYLDTLGWAHYRNGDIENAVKYLERAVASERSQSSPAPHYHLGLAYAANENVVGARNELTQATEFTAFEWVDDARAALAALN